MENRNVSSSSSSGIGFIGLLTVAFIVLKLIGIIKWSWLWVLSPIWIPLAVLLIVVILVIIAVFIRSLFKRKRQL
jgi:membrane protein YdbS with pleckstrin-like domain